MIGEKEGWRAFWLLSYGSLKPSSPGRGGRVFPYCSVPATRKTQGRGMVCPAREGNWTDAPGLLTSFGDVSQIFDHKNWQL